MWRASVAPSTAGKKSRGEGVTFHKGLTWDKNEHSTPDCTWPEQKNNSLIPSSIAVPVTQGCKNSGEITVCLQFFF